MGEPLVTCIMPTRDRRRFVPRAIACFLAQDWEARELVVIDDGADPIGDLLPADPRVRYFREGGGPASTGHKRNRACAQARGEVIVHWDDDDWSAPGRIRHQVQALLAAGAEVCGFSEAHALDRERGLAWRFAYPPGRAPRLLGGSLCYLRVAWQRTPFPDLRVGEDSRFVRGFQADRVLSLADGGRYVFFVHRGNTSPKQTSRSCYAPCAPERVEALMAPMDPPAAVPPAERGVDLSVVIPAFAGGVALLRRTVAALDAQTADATRYEVVIAVDGGDDGSVRAVVEPERRRARFTLVDSARPQGRALPHRNHARNAAARAAGGRWLWFLDGDFLLPGEAVSHMLAQLEGRGPEGVRPAVLSPTLAGISEEPAAWLRRSGAWSDGDGAGLAQLLAGVPIVLDQYSGYGERHVPGPARSEPCPGLKEGFPCLPAALFHALGGFEEAFVGWGGNKEELVVRLRALAAAGLIDLRLLTSVRAVHQPHAPDPGRSHDHPRRRSNAKLFAARAAQIGARAPWWRAQQARVVAALGGVAAARPAVVGPTPARRAPVVASLATLPERAELLARTVESLLPQVDRLRVYLNGHQDRPACLDDPRVEVAWSRDHGDRGDAGKFFWCEEASGDEYLFSCDDDIVYPPDYVSRLVLAIERYGRRAVVGVHGIRLRTTVRSYYRDRHVIHYAGHLAADRAVHLLGSGCAAWHAGTLRLQRSHFRLPNMADIWLGLACQQQAVPMRAVARPAAWLRPQEAAGSIFRRFRDRDVEQTRVVNGHRRWRLLVPTAARAGAVRGARRTISSAGRSAR